MVSAASVNITVRRITDNFEGKSHVPLFKSVVGSYGLFMGFVVVDVYSVTGEEFTEAASKILAALRQKYPDMDKRKVEWWVR